jgi:hypothetical protein
MFVVVVAKRSISPQQGQRGQLGTGQYAGEDDLGNFPDSHLGSFRLKTRTRGLQGKTSMEQIIFMICMFFGVAAAAMIAFTLLMIVMGKVDV